MNENADFVQNKRNCEAADHSDRVDASYRSEQETMDWQLLPSPARIDEVESDDVLDWNSKDAQEMLSNLVPKHSTSALPVATGHHSSCSELCRSFDSSHYLMASFLEDLFCRPSTPDMAPQHTFDDLQLPKAEDAPGAAAHQPIRSKPADIDSNAIITQLEGQRPQQGEPLLSLPTTVGSDEPRGQLNEDQQQPGAEMFLDLTGNQKP